MPPPLSLQLYTLREAMQTDFRSVLKEVAEIGFIGVEPAGYCGVSPREFGKIIRDLGLEISSAHGAFPTGEEAERVLEEHEQLGNKWIVSGFGADTFKTEDGVKKAAEKLAEAAVNAATRGMRIAVHNHEFEFTNQFDGRSAYALMMELTGPNVFGELDIYWVQTGGEDPVKILQEQPARFPLLHVKDGPCLMGQPMTAVGAGTVDIRGNIAAATAAEWHVVELDHCATDMMDAVRQSYKFLTENGLSVGRK